MKDGRRNWGTLPGALVLVSLAAACNKGEPAPAVPAPAPPVSAPTAESAPAATPAPAPPAEEPKGPITLFEERRPGPNGLTLVGSTLVWYRQRDVRGMSLADGKAMDLGAGPRPGTVRPVSDGAILYWVSAGFDGISAMPVSGGDVTPIPIKLPTGVRSLGQGAIGLNATSIFVVGTGSAVDASHPETATLFSVSMTDGVAQVLAKVPSASSGSVNIVADGDSVFWTSAGAKVGKKEIAPILYEYQSSDKTNESMHDFAPGTAIQALAGDKSSVYVSVGGTAGGNVDGGAAVDGWIGRISKRTRALSVLVEHVNAPFLALDDDSIYFTSQDAKTLSKVPKTGGAPEVLWHGDDRPDDVVADDRYVYWINHTNMSIMRIEKKK